MKKYYTNFLFRRFRVFILCCFFSSGVVYTAKTQPQLTFTPLIQNLNLPVNVKNAGDSSGRLFIVEQTGKIKIYKNGAVQPTPFIDLTSLVAVGEYKGLWSIAFAPDYKKSRQFFVYYHDKGNNTILARYQASKTNPDSAVLSSRVELLSLKDTVTNGPHLGEMHFGKDGYLYITINDGSYLGNTTKFAQDGQSLFGKMLRLNIKATVAPYYSIPPDNPFINDSTVRDEIWLLGFRNAWRWSFDRTTLNMWIADDGGEQWDEVSVRTRKQPVGANMGWPCYEGTQPFLTKGCKDSSTYTFPIFINPPDTTGAQAIIGGYVYRGKAYRPLKGYYVCADYVQNKAWKIITNGAGGWNIFEQINIPAGITSFGEGEDAELYATSSSGIVYKVGAVNPVAGSKN
ncbi:PQQ-dependent sugar dehydrogenase [Panacibacter ginsenosidivorans]|uniref:PQQ-dependent sugar dehydrogenase n=1 Tax=Panacibacter ginsenosidivorans TaxID=1813871 RepID=A0A5B8V8L6_9BACT|nr:PQQ-dependent sugar dehydrogenase [Panacibacter ginsenosidivorans]QEC66708.1 PQQ-dependent sugar dehydrogenase [Panacibacter ginsenosidivorans]